ncbi:MAG: CdaR family protein [Blautia sp.]|nr:CdaR family protein [Blautia sp.]MDY5030835.1 CdaR family protein [Blautia sp.]
MKRKFANNISLKIMSLAIGILVWLIVSNINNPVVTRTFVIPKVELLNEAYIEDTGMVCMKDENQSSVRVTISGEQKVLNRITSEDIQVAADLQQAVSLDTDPVMVPLSVSCRNAPLVTLSVTPQNYSVHLDEKYTQEFAVIVNRGESKPGKGYEIGTQTVSPEKVRITGPKSLIAKIDKVSANVNVDGIVEDRTEAVSLTITDKNQDTLSEVSMSNLKIDNNANVYVTTRLWKVRTDLNMSAGYVGEPQAGYTVDSITTVPDTISLAGTGEALEALKQNNNTIEIPPELVDISSRKKDVEVKINLTDILPEGLKLTSGSSEDVWVRVTILPEGSHTYTIPTSEIEVKNKPEDMQIIFDIDKIEIRVKADDGNLEDFDESRLKASVNLDGMEEGDYTIPVDIVLPEGYSLIEKVKTEIRVSKVAEIDENNGE